MYNAKAAYKCHDRLIALRLGKQDCTEKLLGKGQVTSRIVVLTDYCDYSSRLVGHFYYYDYCTKVLYNRIGFLSR